MVDWRLKMNLLGKSRYSPTITAEFYLPLNLSLHFIYNSPTLLFFLSYLGLRYRQGMFIPYALESQGPPFARCRCGRPDRESNPGPFGETPSTKPATPGRRYLAHSENLIISKRRSVNKLLG